MFLEILLMQTAFLQLLAWCYLDAHVKARVMECTVLVGVISNTSKSGKKLHGVLECEPGGVNPGSANSGCADQQSFTDTVGNLKNTIENREKIAEYPRAQLL